MKMLYDTKQMALFEGGNPEYEYKELINKRHNFPDAVEMLSKIDYDFKDFTTQYLTHTFHSYPARFIPQIPLTFIKLFTEEQEIVLDPFCGCGTTLVESFLNNRKSIGNDFNPLATLISKVKTTLIEDTQFRYFNRKLAVMKRYLDLDYRRVNEKINNLPNRKISAIFSKTAKIVEKNPEVRVICGDARKLEVQSDSIDLVVTSPPYVNALDYYRVHMYNMLWLGMDFDLFRKHEIGGHSHFITNRFRLLSEYLGDMLRSMIEMNRVLKKDKLCVIVVGNSSVEYELIESPIFFEEMGDKIGFTPIKTIFRNIDKTKKYTSADVGKIDEEYIVVMRKEKNSDVVANNDDFVSEVVRNQMIRFREQIKNVQGTSIRGRKPTRERLLKNIDKISEAIETIPKDTKIKR